MGFLGDIKTKIEKTNRGIEKRKIELKKINSSCACSKEVIKELNEQLRENEDIKYFTGGLYKKKYYNIFITNKSIIFISSDIFNKEQLQVPIEKITSISKKKGLLGGKIQIWEGSNSSVIIENIPTKSIDILVNKINEQMENYKSFNIEINKTLERDITDKIEKLSDLYKDGVLTEYEFSIKKMELLDKLKK